MSKKGYLLQAIAIPAWWFAMVVSEHAYSRFAFPGIGRTAFFSFLLPDIAVITALSYWVLLRPNKVIQACILGGFAYGTLWCLSASIVTHGGYLSTIVMLLGTLFNLLLFLGPDVFRPSRTSESRRNLLVTIVQSTVIWTMTLVVFPLGIVHAFGHWPPQLTIASSTMGGVLFAAFSFLGMWSGYIMATRGEGTPLPTVGPQRLVISGPYGYVRNPMAIAGLGQGLSVAIVLRSLEVAAYVAVGLLLWQCFVRPEEERYLQNQFGDEYARYRESIRCWMPRSHRFNPRPDPRPESARQSKAP